MFYKKHIIPFCAAILLISLPQSLNAQETLKAPLKCKYAFEDYRIYCLVLRDTVLVSSVNLQGADPIYCPNSPMVSVIAQNSFLDKIYDRGEVIRINLGMRCAISGYAIDVAGKKYQFNAD